MDSNKKTIIRLAVVLVVIILIVVGIILGGGNSNKNPSLRDNPISGDNTADSQNPPDSTREPVPANVSVPDKNSNVANNVANPENVLPAAPNSNSSYRNFEIKAQSNKFSPDTIIVKQNDVININISAGDKNYNFTQPDYGLQLNILKGEKKSITFQASAAGKFTFFCASCGGPQKGPVGYIVVK